MANNPVEVAYLQRFNNSVDGWALNSALYPSPYVYQWLCVEAMDAVRNANNYRPKIYGIPDITTFYSQQPQGMTPFTDYITQVRMLPGTIILGMSMGLSGSGTWLLQNNFYVDVTDDATGIPFFSDWLSEQTFNVPAVWNSVAVANVQDYVAKTAWLPLTRPRPVLSPGICSVTMSFKGTPSSTNPIFPQLTILCAEPCNMFRAQGECE